MIPLGGALRRLRGKRGFGYRPDGKSAPRAKDVDALGLTRVGVGDILLATGPVLDQGGTNSCVAQAICDAEVTTLLNRYHVTAALGSRRFLYWLARQADGMQSWDAGSRPTYALEVLRERGLPPEERMPWSEWHINQAPPFSALWDGRGRRGMRGYYKIYDHGDARVGAIRASLGSGRAVVFGVEVDDAFTALDGPAAVYWRDRGKVAGRHMMEVVGHLDTAGLYVVKNSYGPQFRQGGFIRMDEEWIDTASDVIVVDPEEPVQ